MASPQFISRECVWCGNVFEFERKRGAQPKSCSSSCRRSYVKADARSRAKAALAERGPLMYAVVCSECGDAFTAGHSGRHLCSDRCRIDRTTRLRRESNAGQSRNRSRDLTCAHCESAFRGKPGQKFCSKACQSEAQVATGKRRRNIPRKSEFRRRAERLSKSALAGTNGGGLVWVQGPCIVCSSQFLSKGVASRYCSPECRAVNRRRSFGLSWLDRMDLFARDEWLCQLCFRPVDYTADMLSNMYPSLDHIIPRSKGGSDDPSNLQLAHRICNSIRRDRPVWEVRHPLRLGVLLAATS